MSLQLSVGSHYFYYLGFFFFFLTFTCKCLPLLQRRVLFKKNKCFESYHILHALYCLRLCFNNFIGGNSQLDFDAICENDDTAMTALMNYLEADGGLGDPAELSDIQWAL